MNTVIYVVKILNNRTESFDIIGGVFDCLEKVNQFIESNNLDRVSEVNKVILNHHHVVTVGNAES
jgi:ribonuclease BN (tRNA processing enzyme)